MSTDKWACFSENKVQFDAARVLSGFPSCVFVFFSLFFFFSLSVKYEPFSVNTLETHRSSVAATFPRKKRRKLLHGKPACQGLLRDAMLPPNAFPSSVGFAGVGYIECERVTRPVIGLL